MFCYKFGLLSPVGMTSRITVLFRTFSWTMLIVLPDERNGLPNLLKIISRKNGLDYVLQHPHYVMDIKLSLPRFKLSDVEQLEIKALMQQMGVNDLFSQSSADLSGISDTQKLCISSIQHKAILEVSKVQICVLWTIWSISFYFSTTLVNCMNYRLIEWWLNHWP